MQTPSLPFTIVILAPFAGKTAEPWAAGPLHYDTQVPDSIYAQLHPSVFIPLPAELCPQGGLELSFFRRRDFTPDGLVAHQPYLASLLEAREFLVEAGKKNLPADQVHQKLKKWPDLPPTPYRQKSELKETRQSEPLDNILAMVSLPDSGMPGDGSASDGYAGIATQILEHIFRDPTFVRMEAAWQGLHMLASECPPENAVKIMLVPTSQDTFEDTMDALLPSLLQTPPAMILVDLPFGGSLRSVNQLTRLADFGQTLLVPTLAWITADFFQVENWHDFDHLAYLPHHMEQQIFAKWKTARQSPANRWLCLLCNRFLFRYPYGPDNMPRNIAFTEPKRPWLAPVWAAARLVCQRLSQTKWPIGASSWQNALKDLALDMTDEHHPLPIEIQFTENRLEQLEKCGIVALAANRGKDSIVLSGNTMVSGDTSLDYQLLLNLVTRFTLWCKDTFPENAPAEELAAALRREWKSYLDCQQTVPEDMLMEVEITGSEQQPIVRLHWRPSRKVLPSGQELELEFAW